MSAPTETQLWIDNDEGLHRRKWFLFAHLAKFLDKGTFKATKAIKIFRHLTSEAARKYKAEIGEVLDVKDRREAEKDFVAEFQSRVADRAGFDRDLAANVKPSTLPTRHRMITIDVAEAHRRSIAREDARMPKPMRDVLSPREIRRVQPLAFGDTKLAVWEERDRLHIELKDHNDETLAEWWDDDARQMIEDGFFDRKNLHRSVFDYVTKHKIIKPKHDVPSRILASASATPPPRERLRAFYQRKARG